MVDSGIIAVVRAETSEQALNIADACRRGGIEVIEITMTVPGALDAIKELVKAYPWKEVLVGAGTVLDPETAQNDPCRYAKITRSSALMASGVALY